MSQGKNICRIALVQTSVGMNCKCNLVNAVNAVRRAVNRGAKIVCLQELFSAPYFCQEESTRWFDLAEPIPGPTSKLFQEVAQELGVVIITPIFERRAAGVYHNSAVVIDADGTLVGLYRKMHIPDDPLYYEKFYFTPGDQGFQAFDTKFARIGVLICWDQWYPEAARLTALQGAQLIFCPTAIGWHPSEGQCNREEQFEAWKIVQRSHAVANGVFVAAVNRVGYECLKEGSLQKTSDCGGIHFWGGSFVANPMAAIIASAGCEEGELLIADCDLGLIEETRRDWPFFRDRRIDSYAGISKRFLDD